MSAATVAVLLVLLVLLCALVMLGALGTGPPKMGGAGARLKRPETGHVVVDTLNLAHWLRPRSSRAPLSLEEIVRAVDRAAPRLRRKFPGRVMFVLKDQETQHASASTKSALAEAARRNNCYVYLVARYEEPPSGVPVSTEHSSLGRDDFYMALLAFQWRCSVATEDRLTDFSSLRRTLQPFHVTEWAYWRALPQRDFIRPESLAYSRIRKPRTARFSSLLGELQPARSDEKRGSSRGGSL